MGKEIWIIRYVNESEMMAAENIKTAYLLMKEYINKFQQTELLEELKTEYEHCLNDKKTFFGVEDVCSAELIPLYSYLNI